MIQAIFHKTRALLNLRNDTNYDDTDKSIRKNVDFESGNAWTLVFAIFIASVGLNVNSGAVIIGAMLISPLMGPIVGIGYALGVNDPRLLRRSLRNLTIAMLISVFTSSLYFLLSPYDEAQSELLARTAPNFYDVLIAIFGGAAGIVATSRKEKSNAIPGVAIATALMPPLCTAGFGIANGEWKFTLGALYLFLINSVFISFSTYVFVRSLKFKKVTFPKEEEVGRIDRWIMVIAGVVIVPSLFTAWLLLQESNFKQRAKTFVDREFKFRGAYVLEQRQDFDLKKPRIFLTIVGRHLSKEDLKSLKEKKRYYDLEKAVLNIEQVGGVESIQPKMLASQTPTGETVLLHQRISDLEKELETNSSLKNEQSLLKKELATLYPDLQDIFLDETSIKVFWKKAPATKTRKMLDKFLAVRRPKVQNVQHVLNL